MTQTKTYSLLSTLSFRANFASIFSTESDGHKNNLPALDGMRALCVCWVVLHHYLLTIQSYFKDTPVFRTLVDNTPTWLAPVWHGELAVEFFFVLSGFLIGGTLMREFKRSGQINVKRFYASRFLRLMPSFIVALWVFSPFLPNTEYMWANLLYISNYMPFDKMYMPWTWTLVLQEQFYLLLPAFLLFVFYPTKNKWWLFGGLFVASAAIRYWIQLLHPEVLNDHPANFMFFSYPGFNPEYFNYLYTGLHVRFAPLILGLLAAYLQVYHLDQLKRVMASSVLGYVLVALALGYMIFNLSIPYYDIRYHFTPAKLTFLNVFSYNLFSLAVMIMLLAVIYPNKLSAPLKWLLSLRLWFPIAQLSFVMYLFHMIFVAIGCLLLKNYANLRVDEWQDGQLPIHWIMAFAALTFAGTILFSFIFSMLIERPFMNFRKFQWFKQLGAVRTNAVPAVAKEAV